MNLSRRGFLFGSAALVATASAGALPVIVQRFSEADLIALLGARMKDVEARMVAAMADHLFGSASSMDPFWETPPEDEPAAYARQYEWRTLSMPVEL